MREKDTAIERCDVTVEDGEGTGKSRFIVKIACRHGMVSNIYLDHSNTLARRSENLPLDIRVCLSDACSLCQGIRGQCLVNLL